MEGRAFGPALRISCSGAAQAVEDHAFTVQPQPSPVDEGGGGQKPVGRPWKKRG